MDLFKTIYEPLIQAGTIKAFDLYTLDDATERDDHCANIYNKSLLYLVSHAFEEQPRIPLVRPNGTPILGMARDVAEGIPAKFWQPKSREFYVAPAATETDARRHGDFDNDPATLRTTLGRIIKGPADDAPVLTAPSPAGAASTRAKLNAVLEARF